MTATKRGSGNHAETDVEEKEILASLGLADLDAEASTVPNSTNKMHPALAVALGGCFVLNLGILLSLPPVIRGKGAPYLPTFQKGMDSMFSQLRKDPHLSLQVSQGMPLRFVDLGSGDGRVVFRAAREGLFHKSIGYEINPLLHLWAQCRRLIQAPKYWSTTDFALRDIWKVSLTNVDVVAVYGLDPIMKDLSKKLKAELKPGSMVVSNVFTFPGWRPSTLSHDNVHIYKVPTCWEPSDSAGTER